MAPRSEFLDGKENWDHYNREVEIELFHSPGVLYRWKEEEKEWADVGPGNIVILEFPTKPIVLPKIEEKKVNDIQLENKTQSKEKNEDEKEKEKDLENVDQVTYKLVFRNWGNYKIRSNHIIRPGKCEISKDFENGIEIQVQNDDAVGGISMKLCFSFEVQTSTPEKILKEFEKIYRFCQKQMAQEQVLRKLLTLHELVLKGFEFVC